MSTNREDRLDINGSGYYDPTPGEALGNILKSGKVKRGDVWTTHFGATEKRLAVLAVNGEVCSMVILLDKRTGDWDRPMETAEGLCYYTPSRIGFRYIADLERRTGNLGQAAVEEMLQAVADTLGLPTAAPAPQIMIAEQFETTKEPSQTERELREEIVRLEAARDLYREEYRELLAHLTGKGEAVP